MTSSFFARRLVWQPVQHSCGHYEARLMAPRPQPVNAGSACSTCAPQGRVTQPQYLTVQDAQTACTANNAQEARA